MGMAEQTVSLGSRFRKADCPGLVFEVVETISNRAQAHVRVARVGWPDDRRVYSVGVLTDPHFFTPEGIAHCDNAPANDTPANGVANGPHDPAGDRPDLKNPEAAAADLVDLSEITDVSVR